MIIKEEEQTRFIVFTAGWNSQRWAKKNILSVKKQSYSNFIHVVIDDATTDKTKSIIKAHKHDRLFVHRNSKNQKWIKNSLDYLPQYITSDEDVIVIVDLDDWLAGPNVLPILNKIYSEEDVWMTYGSFVSASKTGKRTSKPRLKGYTKTVIRDKSYRKIKWNLWHPRTFKAFLWLNIKHDDLKGPDGKWAKYTYDKAIGFPMLEMCPAEKIRWIKDVLYIYNRGNPHASSSQKSRGGGHGGHFRKIKPYKTLKRTEI
jgi:glycosyltransferase involved in cell wall biosynthesis